MKSKESGKYLSPESNNNWDLVHVYVKKKFTLTACKQ